MTDELSKPEPRIASHPDDPDALFADRLLLALRMWPKYVEELGADEVIEAAVIVRSNAHRFQFAAEDYGNERENSVALESLISQFAYEVWSEDSGLAIWGDPMFEELKEIAQERSRRADEEVEPG